MTDLLIGADVGGTTTRVAVADAAGTILGVSQQAAGNPNAVGVHVSAKRIRAAMEAALRQAQGTLIEAALRQAQGTLSEATVRQAQGALSGRGTVVSVAIGMGGYGTARSAGDEFARACTAEGVNVRPRIVADLATAYASAGTAPHGFVIIAGTGAGAAEIDRAEIVARRGAWGWLLGDEGSGFWLGREAVRWALSQVERDDPPSPLTTAVLDHLGTRDLAGLLRIPYEQPPYAGTPVRLADLSVLISELTEQDPAAARIADRAGELLADQVLELLAGADSTAEQLPIVTGGAVLQTADRVRHTFTERVRATTDAPVLGAESGLVGALWISAATTADGDPAAAQPDPGIHERMRTTLARFRD